MNSAAPSSGIPARQAALALLHSVLDEHETLDVAMASPLYTILQGPDRAFAHALAAAVLRRLGTIDAIIGRYVKKLPPVAALNLLRLGVAQIVMLDTPAHAAVSTSVNIAKAGPARGQSGLINAVLRRVTADVDALKAVDAPEVPLWLLSRWRRIYGLETAEAVARVTRVEPPLDLSVRDEAARAPLLAAGGLDLPGGCVRFSDRMRVEDLPGFEAGSFWVQGAAARVPVQVLGPRPGLSVLDMCAAPGGKTMQLAAAGAVVTALDDSAARMARLRENLTRTRLDATLVVADGALWKGDHLFDAVLLDAPCTSTGVFRRKPDGPWIKRAEDIAALSRVQARLLDAAVAQLKPGGILVYAVCSLEPEEGEAQIKSLLARTASVVRTPLQPKELPGLEEALTAEGDARVLPTMWPDCGGIDGFFVSRLAKI
jgi:16S rRNA (cytosine967-C5)-methyltransferase